MIAFFVYDFDSYSGSGQQAFLLAKNIDQNILLFNYFKPKYKKYRLTDKIVVIDLPRSVILTTLIVFMFTLKYKIKIYHMHGGFPNIQLLGILLGRKNILKTTLLGSDDFDTLSMKKSWNLWYFAIRHLAKNIVLSDKAREINSKYIDSNKIVKISNGVTVPDICPSFVDKENSFCFAGLICQRKRTLDSIQYFIDNYSMIPTTRMYVIGPYQGIEDSTKFTNEYVRECFKLIDKYDMSDRIIFTGEIKKDQVHKFFSKCKALLFFSEKEGMPNVVLEAMANNCVPIVSEMDGVSKEIFDSSVGGYILDNTNHKISINMIDKLIEEQGPYLTIKKSSIENIAQTYKEIYNEL